MKAQSYAGLSSYLFILLGLALAFISAMVPHFTAGYTLTISVFSAGIAPWFVYGMAVPLRNDAITRFAGLLLVIAHAWLVVQERIVGGGDYNTAAIYVAPIVFALLMLPLAIRAFALTRPDRPDHA